MTTTVAFAHATGFCGGVWKPVVATLPDDFETRVWDFPCHGSAPKLEHPIDWWVMGDWALRQLAGVRGPLIGVGHSMGGAALLMVEIKAPGTFAELLLVEPIVFPPPFGRFESPLAALAEKRRNQFASREEARANFAGKAPFSAWDPLALDGYIECGLVETGEGIELACRPEDEAEIYRAATQHGAWDLLGDVEVPVHVVAGEFSETHPPEFVRSFASRVPDCEVEIVPGTGHFLPMELPGSMSKRIVRIGGRLTG
jgi:pimeloyl-ACP methyl ester carboxylesterase